MNPNNLKTFFIKLISITFAIIIIINVSYNLILADKLESINSILQINKKENIDLIKNKIRLEIEKGIKKEFFYDNNAQRSFIIEVFFDGNDLKLYVTSSS